MLTKRKSSPRRASSLRLVPLIVLAAITALLAAFVSGAAAAPAVRATSNAAAATTAPIWHGDYNSGLSQFASTSWNNVPDAPSVVSSPVAEGSGAGRYIVPAGGSRCENVPLLRNLVQGDDLWFGWSTMLGTGFPVTSSAFQVITQWKNDGTGSPPLELKVANGQFVVDGGYGWPGNTGPSPRYSTKAIGAAKTNVWDRWTAHIKFSSNASVGYIDLSRNGTPVLTGFHLTGGTLYPGLHSYLKVGYYRDSSITTPGTVYQDAWKVGTSAASVA